MKPQYMHKDKAQKVLMTILAALFGAGVFLFAPQSIYAAAPQIVGSATSSRSTNATDDSVTLPGSIAAGDLIIVFHFSDSSTTRTFPGSWQEIKDTTCSGSVCSIGIAYLIASGGETSVTVTKNVIERFTAIAIRISASSWHGTTPPEISTGSTGSNTDPNPDSVTASWGSADNLFIASMAWDDSTGGGVILAYPTNYSSNQTVSPDVSSAGRGAIATRELTASNDDPSAFLIVSDQWWAGTLVVRPAAAPTPTPTPANPSVYIGIDTDASSNPWEGSLNSFTIYNYARTADQIKADALSHTAQQLSASFGGATKDNLTDGLIGYWKLDESSDNASDASGNSTTLTDGSTTTYASGKFFRGADLESSSTDYLYAADNTTLSLTGSLTVVAWIKPESVTAATAFDIVGKWDGSNETYLLQQYGDEIRFYINSSSNYIETSAANLTTGSWYHIAGSYNHTTATAEIIINGAKQAVTSVGTIPTSLDDDTGRFHVGAEDSTTSTTNYYDGIVDEIRIYNRALSTAEVSRLYNWAPTPVGHWKLDENTSIIANDTSGSANTGTLTSGPLWGTGKFGSAVNFDGTDDFITTSSSTSLSPTSQLTVEGWVRMSSGFSTSSSYHTGMVDKGDYQFYLDKSDGKAHWVLNDAAADAYAALGTLNDYVYAMAVWNGNLYIGGKFIDAGGDADADYIAKWDGSSFSWPSVTPLNNDVNALTVWNGNLYIAGLFIDAGGDADADYIAKWDGSTFSWPSGQSLTDTSYTLAVWRDNLYVGGSFLNAGGDADADKLAKWDGSTFSWTDGQGTGGGANNHVENLTVWRDALYVVSDFVNIGGDADADYIAKWDGSTFSWPSGQSLTDTSYTLAVWRDNLYVGGKSLNAGGDADADYIAKWDGSTFSWPSVTPLNNNVRALTVWNGNLYIAGLFINAGGDADADYITRWDNSSFSWPSVTPLTNDVENLNVWNGNLYIGGKFTILGGSSIDYAGRWGTSATKSLASTTSSWTTDTWYHWAGTYDGSTTKLYINGILENSASSSISLENQSTDLYLGKMHGQHGSSTSGGSGELLNGSLDDVRIYNYARTPGQIIEDMNAGHPLGGSPVGSMIGWWKLDEGYGTSTVSNSGSLGSSLNASLNGSPVWTNSAKINKAIDFDGSNDFLALSDSTTIEPTNMTLSSWFKLDQLPSTKGEDAKIFMKVHSSSPWVSYELFVDTDDHIYFGWVNSSGTYYNNYSPSIVNSGTWYHVAGVQTDNQIKLYINGRLIDTDTITGTLYNSDTALRIGAASASNQRADGIIDELKFYNAALTADEIMVDYNQGKSATFGFLSTASDGTTPDNSSAREYCIPGDPSICNAPVGEWKLDENTGTSGFDTSGNEKTANFTGPTWGPGKFGSAAKFDGTDDYALVSNSYNNASTTLSFWFKLTGSTGATQVLVNKYQSTSSGWGVRYHSDSTIEIWDDIGGVNNSHYDTAISLNQWYHVVAILKSDNTNLLYLNSVLLGSTETSSNNLSSFTGNLYIGQRGNSTNYVQGLIDQIRVYDYALTPAQISWEFNHGAPIARYKLDETTGTTAYNSAINGNGDAAGMNGATSGATVNQSGKLNTCYDFDGTDDVITVTNADAIDFDTGLKNGMSYAFWVYANSDGEADIGEIFDKGANTYCRTDTQGSSDLDLECQIDLVTAEANLNISDGLTTNTWTHVAVTYSDDSDDEVTVYINGVNKGSSSDGNGAPQTTDTNNLLIGGDTSHNFDGLIDDFLVFNYELTPKQVSTIMNSGAVSFQ